MTEWKPRRAARGAFVLALLSALALTGCGTSVSGAPRSGAAVENSSAVDTASTTDQTSPEQTSSEQTTTDSTTDGTTTSSTSTDSTTTSSTSQTGPAKAPVLAYGQQYTWANGIGVIVSAPKKYTPKDPDNRKRGKEFVYFTIVVINGSKQAYDAGDLRFRADNGTTDTGHGFYDENLPYQPEISLVPGQRATFTKSSGLPDTRHIVATVSPDGDSNEISYALDGTGRSTSETGAGEPLTRFIGVQKFGGTYTFATGLRVTVGTLSAYTPGADAIADKASRYLLTTITVTNGSRETISPGSLSYGLAEQVVQRNGVRDRTAKIGTLPDGRYPPGSSFTVKAAFGVEGTSDLVLDVRLSNSGTVVFTDAAVPRYDSAEPGAKTTPSGPAPAPTSGGAPAPTSGSTPGPVADEVAVKGSAEAIFGVTVSWVNGVSAAVGKPQSFIPSSSSRQPKGTQPLKFAVTITNGGKEPLTSYVSAIATSGGYPCLSVVDSASKVGLGQLDLEPGKTATVVLGCFAKNPADLVIQLRPDFPYNEAFITSTGPQKPKTVTPSKESESDEAARKVGATFVYASGISLTVRTRAAIPVASAAGDGKTYLAVEGTFTNNTAKPFRLISWTPRVLDGDAAAETFDNDRDFITIGGAYLLPGRSLTLAEGVILSDPKKISITNRDPSYDGPTITWTP